MQGRRCGYLDPRSRPARFSVPDKRFAIFTAGNQPVIRPARVVDNQLRGVGVAQEVVEIDPTRFQQLMDERQHENAVGPRCDADPFIGNSVVTGAHGIDRDDLCAAFL